MTTILERWKITAEELTDVIDRNPSLYGFLLGYVGELQLRKQWFSDEQVTRSHKFDDHDRRHKNDLSVHYQGLDFSLEVKSLQTNSIKVSEPGYTGNFQCDASDRRPVILPNHKKVETTCLVVGGFDIVAVNLYAFRQQWEFGFALNRDLPRTTSKKYKPSEQKYLLATLVPISLPLQEPFVSDPFLLLDQLVAERKSSQRTLTKTRK